jgi:hypothetical protein
MIKVWSFVGKKPQSVEGFYILYVRVAPASIETDFAASHDHSRVFPPGRDCHIFG